MKKIFILFAIVALGTPKGQAQQYFVSSLATPGAAIFSAGQDQDGVISLPFEAGTRTIEVETNQEAITVNCDAEWCRASMKGKALTLAVTENNGDEARRTFLNVNSKDFHPLLITILQEKSDNPYRLVSNNFIRTFVERTKDRPQSFVLKEQGKLNAIKKAYQLTEFSFVPTGVIERNNGYEPYNPNVLYKGMIYSSAKETGTFVPNAVSFYTFATAVHNPRSKLYIEHINESPYHGTNCRAYYGSVCSSLVSYALGLNPSYGSQDFVDSDVMEDIGYEKPEDIEVGDVLWRPSHVAIITDILRDEDNSVQMVEVSESIHNGCRTVQYSRNRFHQVIMNWETNSFEKVVRYKNMEDNTNYESFPEFVAVAGETPVSFIYNEDLCVDKGDNSNYLKGEDVTINIFSPYDSVVVYKDNERFESFTKGNKDGDIVLYSLPYGTYSASIWKNKQKTKETSWIVVDYDVSYNKREQTIYFSSKNSTPTQVRLCSQTGGRGVSKNKLLYRLITDEERASGYLIVPVDKYVSDKYSYVQVKFETEYGTISTLPLIPNE